MAADWTKIKSEYVTGTMSYRDLAKKYHMDQSTIAKTGSKEGWVKDRQRFAIKAQAKVEAKMADGVAKRAQKVMKATDTLLNKTIQYMDMVDPEMLSGKDLQALAGALKGIKELQDIRSDLDIKEQEARIENLRRQTLKDELAKEPVKVVMDSDAEEFAE